MLERPREAGVACLAGEEHPQAAAAEALEEPLGQREVEEEEACQSHHQQEQGLEVEVEAAEEHQKAQRARARARSQAQHGAMSLEQEWPTCPETRPCRPWRSADEEEP